jgi:hypothetical protein
MVIRGGYMQRLSRPEFEARFPKADPALPLSYSGIDGIPIVIDRDAKAGGIFKGGITVRNNASAIVSGIVHALIIENGSVVYFDGIVTGDVELDGALFLTGIVKGNLRLGGTAVIALDGTVAGETEIA